MRNGFAKIRSGLEDHLVSGRVGFFEAGIYLAIHLQADFRTGVWIGSAPRLTATAPRGASLRAVQRAMERLEEIGFIRSFHTSGVRGNYRVFIHKYEPCFGALKGKRLNALASVNWRSPIYEAVAEDDAVRDAVSVAEDAPYQEVDLELRSKKLKDAAAKKPSSPSDPRFQSFVDFAFEAFRAKHGQPPAWSGQDYNNLKALLKRSPNLSLEELERRFTNYRASTEPFTVNQGDSLKYFATNFDRFIDGPIGVKVNATSSKNNPGAIASKPGKYDRVEPVRVSNA